MRGSDKRLRSPLKPSFPRCSTLFAQTSCSCGILVPITVYSISDLLIASCRTDPCVPRISLCARHHPLRRYFHRSLISICDLARLLEDR
ncbi:hypothetical protein AFLA_002596 [Aspergillus flavus NRRL3357]|nr:hypothetical protein AFLA_002596 [Aspergillus flavus NRRL3357]